jgi:hypothetical protein
VLLAGEEGDGGKGDAMLNRLIAVHSHYSDKAGIDPGVREDHNVGIVKMQGPCECMLSEKLLKYIHEYWKMKEKVIVAAVQVCSDRPIVLKTITNTPNGNPPHLAKGANSKGKTPARFDTPCRESQAFAFCVC